MHDIIKESPIYQEVLQEGEDRGLQRELQIRLVALRQMLLTFVQARSPRILEQARIQTNLIGNPKILEDLSIKIGLAQTEEEAEHYLLNWRTIYKDLQPS